MYLIFAKALFAYSNKVLCYAMLCYARPFLTPPAPLNAFFITTESACSLQKVKWAIPLTAHNAKIP